MSKALRFAIVIASLSLGLPVHVSIAAAQPSGAAEQPVSAERAELLEKLNSVVPNLNSGSLDLRGGAASTIARTSDHLKQRNPGRELQIDNAMSGYTQCLADFASAFTRSKMVDFTNTLSDSELREMVELYSSPEFDRFKAIGNKAQSGAKLTEEEEKYLLKKVNSPIVTKYFDYFSSAIRSTEFNQQTAKCVSNLQSTLNHDGIIGLESNPITAEVLAATPLPAPIPATALQLAREWAPWDAIVTEIVDVTTAGYRKSLLQNPDIVAANKKYPRLIESAVAAAKQHTTATARRTQRELTKQFADMISTDMTADQIGQTYGFLKSPAGVAYKKLLASFTDRAQITEDEVVRRMGAENVMTMNAFLASPSGNVSQDLYTQFISSAFASLGHTMQQDAQAGAKAAMDAMNAHIAKLAKQTKPATPK
ncbi:MAG: hypothetical protein U9R73_11370 [Pseudomonadota bacterium]|jgi:hypothetical protein|nr:hypothetical protein [Pseudomonadota bacterium]